MKRKTVMMMDKAVSSRKVESIAKTITQVKVEVV
jgi:hypothetical protein